MRGVMIDTEIKRHCPRVVGVGRRGGVVGHRLGTACSLWRSICEDVGNDDQTIKTRKLPSCLFKNLHGPSSLNDFYDH